jgi:hypothetical protein
MACNYEDFSVMKLLFRLKKNKCVLIISKTSGSRRSPCMKILEENTNTVEKCLQ